MDAAAIFLLQTILVVGLPPIVWYGTPLKQVLPLAVVQKACGIALGPSLLGRVAPDVATTIFPPAGVAAFSTVSNLAVILFAFVIGAHLDRAAFAGRGRAFVQISLGSFLAPTALGIATGWALAGLYPDIVGAGASRGQFAVAIGICVGVTALPMLGAILRDMRLLDHRIGQLALRSAVVNDTAVWVLLAMLLAHRAEAQNGNSLWVLILGSVAYLCAMFFIVRPLLSRLTRADRTVDQKLILVSIVAFSSAFATEVLGLHYVLGAFIAGVAVPGEWKQQVLARLETMTATLLLPFFFTTIGLRVYIDVSASAFNEIVLATFAATLLGKILGTLVPARLNGESWRDSFAVGALLQSKGIFVFVALTILLDNRIIDAQVFSALAVMALLTDASCVPLVKLARWRATRTALPAPLPQEPAGS